MEQKTFEDFIMETLQDENLVDQDGNVLNNGSDDNHEESNNEPITESLHHDHTVPSAEINTNKPTTIDKLGTIENTQLDLITFLISSLVIPSSKHLLHAFLRYTSENPTMYSSPITTRISKSGLLIISLIITSI